MFSMKFRALSTANIVDRRLFLKDHINIRKRRISPFLINLSELLKVSDSKQIEFVHINGDANLAQ